MRGHPAISLVCLLCSLTGCAFPPEEPSATPYKRDAGSYAVAPFSAEWVDLQRKRRIGVMVFRPELRGPAPLIVFSSGLGRGPGNYDDLAQHWASHGYVVALVNHPGSDWNALLGKRPFVRYHQVAQDEAEWGHRVNDVAFVLDELMGSEISGSIDFERLAVAGHSYGAHTCLELLGARLELEAAPPQRPFPLAIRAGLLISPPGMGVMGLAPGSWRPITAPMMTIIGTRDTDLLTTDSAARRMGFDEGQAPDQYLVTLQDGTHDTCLNQSIWPADLVLGALHHASIAMVTTAYFDATLKDDAQARAWLRGGQLEAVSAGWSWVEYR